MQPLLDRCDGGGVEENCQESWMLVHQNAQLVRRWQETVGRQIHRDIRLSSRSRGDGDSGSGVKCVLSSAPRLYHKGVVNKAVYSAAVE